MSKKNVGVKLSKLSILKKNTENNYFLLRIT